MRSARERQALSASASGTRELELGRGHSIRSPPAEPIRRHATPAAEAPAAKLATARPGPRQVAARPLAEQRRLAGAAAAPRPAGPGRTRAPTPPAIAISASAQARPPSLMSWAAVSSSGADRFADEAERRAAVAIVTRRQPRPELAAELRQLRAGKGRSERADQGDRVAVGEGDAAGARAGRAARRPGRRPASGRSGPRRSRCRARRCRRRPGSSELGARVGEALDRAVELPGDGRLLGVAEVEAVREAERLGADAGEVLGALEHRLDRAAVGIARDAAAVAVDRDRDRVARLGELEHGGVGRLRPADRSRADDRVVLLERPLLAGDRWARRAARGGLSAGSSGSSVDALP